MPGKSLMLIDAPPTLFNTIIHKKHLSHFMAKTMNELAHKSPLIKEQSVDLILIWLLGDERYAVLSDIINKYM